MKNKFRGTQKPQKDRLLINRRSILLFGAAAGTVGFGLAKLTTDDDKDDPTDTDRDELIADLSDDGITFGYGGLRVEFTRPTEDAQSQPPEGDDSTTSEGPLDSDSETAPSSDTEQGPADEESGDDDPATDDAVTTDDAPNGDTGTGFVDGDASDATDDPTDDGVEEDGDDETVLVQGYGEYGYGGVLNGNDGGYGGQAAA